jgi:hypothetical protein
LRPVAEARLFWPDVRADLEVVRARFGEDWIADDIWHDIMVGNASLWLAGELGAIEAFAVLQINARSYDRALHVWHASERTIAAAADYWPQILQIAAENGCNRVTIETPRRWDLVLPGATTRYLYSFKVEGGSQHVGGQQHHAEH